MRFRTVKRLQTSLKASFADAFAEMTPQDIEVGYIEPGHGARGKQRWITTTEDLKDMYTMYERRSEILLWAFSVGSGGLSTTTKRKRVKSPTDESTPATAKVPRSTKFQEHSQKLQEVEEIAKDLKEKHGDQCTSEQYNVWANMVQMKKYDSRQTPPSKRFFEDLL